MTPFLFLRRRSCGLPCWRGILTWSCLTTRRALLTSRCRGRRTSWRPGAGSHPSSLVSKHFTVRPNITLEVCRSVLVLEPGRGQRSDCAADEQASLSSPSKAGKVGSLQRCDIRHLRHLNISPRFMQDASMLDMMLISWSGPRINFTLFLLTG